MNGRSFVLHMEPFLFVLYSFIRIDYSRHSRQLKATSTYCTRVLEYSTRRRSVAPRGWCDIRSESIPDTSTAVVQYSILYSRNTILRTVLLKYVQVVLCSLHYNTCCSQEGTELKMGMYVCTRVRLCWLYSVDLGSPLNFFFTWWRLPMTWGLEESLQGYWTGV